jgi:tRNA pseudouridine32 synthase/23S rRNA pseudouridine746 synthase/23S rRNA pseudouridine1911/1915/1917 synthase
MHNSRPRKIPNVLYKDALMLVVDKPAGIPVHAGPGGGPNLEQVFGALRFGLQRSPSLAHRLDRDTSGCLVLGRHPKALRKLGRLFSEGRVEKVYWAVVEGAPPTPEGLVDLPLRKETRGAGWKMVPGDGGQSAATGYRTLGAAGGLTWLELRPKTGRTHQIRVHCASLGCPVLGDAAYGGTRVAPLHLHSRAVVVPLYPSRDPIRVEAPPPAHMLGALRACGYPEDAD